MKKLLIGLGIFLGLVLMLLIILPFIIDIKKLVAAQIPAVEKQIHRKISIGDVRLTLLTGVGAEIRNVSISNHPDFRKEAFISMESLRARVRLMPLLKKTVMISSISIVKPDLLIEKDGRGRMNYTDMISTKETVEPDSAASKPKKEPATDPLALLGTIQVSNISIKDARFRFFDASKLESAREYALDRINLSLDAGYSLEEIQLDLGMDANLMVSDVFPKDTGAPLSIRCSTRLRKDELQIEQAKLLLGKMAFNAAVRIQDFAAPRIDGKLDLETTSLENLPEILPVLKPLAPKGKLALTDLRVSGTMDELRDLKGLAGKVSLQNGGLTPAALGKPIEKIQVSATLAAKDVKVQELAFQVGASDIRMDAVVQNILKPAITFNLASSNLDIDGLLPPPSKADQPVETQMEAVKRSDKGTGAAKPSIAPDLKADGHVAVRKCKVKGLQLEDLTAELTYADAEAILKKLRFTIFGGIVSTSARVDLTDMQTPKWRIDLGTENISANAALSQFSDLKDVLYGNMNTRLSIQGSGKDWSSISKSLGGKGSANIVSGKLSSVNLLDAVGQSLTKFQGLGSLAQTLSPQTGVQSTETVFQDLVGKFSLLEGMIQLEDLTMAARDFLLSGVGKIGLDKTLDLRTSMVLSDAVSARLEKDNYMKYLLNKNKKMEIPCAITGNVQKPQVTADGDRLNRMLQRATVTAAKDQLQQGLEKKVGKDAGKLLQGLFQ